MGNSKLQVPNSSQLALRSSERERAENTNRNNLLAHARCYIQQLPPSRQRPTFPRSQALPGTGRREREVVGKSKTSDYSLQRTPSVKSALSAIKKQSGQQNVLPPHPGPLPEGEGRGEGDNTQSTNNLQTQQSPRQRLTPTIPGVIPANRLLNNIPKKSSWSLEQLLGRFVELSGHATSANLTHTADLIREAQTSEEPVAWVSGDRSIFFPPDFERAGIDLDSLPVIRTQTVRKASRATDVLMRSGGFTLVVLDLGERRLPIATQTRLTGLAQKHHTALLCLTRKEAHQPSIGSLVSLRSAAEKIRLEANRFNCHLRVIKDKRRGPGWEKQAPYHGPEGLC